MTTSTVDGDGATRAHETLAPGMDQPPSPTASISSAPSSSFSSSVSPHYDAKNDVIIRVEALSDAATKRITGAIWAATATGAGILIAVLILLTTKPQSFWFVSPNIYAFNAALASVQIVVLTVSLAHFCRRVIIATATGKRWSVRRLRGVQLSIAEQVLQLINSALFLAPNAVTLGRGCAWTGTGLLWLTFGRWTCWNTFFLMFVVQASNMLPLKPVEEARGGGTDKNSRRPDPRIWLDVPLWAHWRKAVLWVAMEAFLLTVTIDLAKNPVVTDPACGSDLSCNFTALQHVMSNLVVAMAVLYLVVYVYYVWRCFKTFYRLPYAPFRMANLIIRHQVRQRGVAFVFFILTTIVYFYVERGSCASFLLAWHGLAPSQLVMTAVAAAQGFLSSPKRPGQAAILGVWLQEFAWTAADLPRKRAERGSSLPPDSFEGFCLDCEPMFCFETALKAMYWSFLAYALPETDTTAADPSTPTKRRASSSTPATDASTPAKRRNSSFTPATALSLFNLDHFDVVTEPRLGTRAVIGWSDAAAAVVIAFRGTANASNVLADLQVWRRRHPRDADGHTLLGTAPMCHGGFIKAYTAGGFNDRLLSRVKHILERCATSGGSGGTADSNLDSPVKVLVTGHSLGGAMAVLCAYDCATRGPCAAYDVDVSCYTFGAPRVGNHAFSAVYNTAVPETWAIVNSDDVVTRAGKFFFLYKSQGHRVIVNRRGDLLVRPSFVEYSLRRSPAGSVRDHLLYSYQRAFLAVLVAQFGGKSIVKGEGAAALAAAFRASGPGTQEFFQLAGLSAEDVRRLEEGRGQLARQTTRRQRRRKPEEEEGRVSLRARVLGWLEWLGGKVVGLEELEKIKTVDEGGSVSARSSEPPSPPGSVSADFGEAGEVTERTESSLLQCHELCQRMGAAGLRCSRRVGGSEAGATAGGQGAAQEAV